MVGRPRAAGIESCGSSQADSIRPSRGGVARKSGSTVRTIGQSADTVARVCRQSLVPLSLGRNMPPVFFGSAAAMPALSAPASAEGV